MSVLMGYRSVIRDYFNSQLTSLTKHKVPFFSINCGGYLDFFAVQYVMYYISTLFCFCEIFWIDRNMKFSCYVCVTCFNGLVGWKPLWGQYRYVWWGPYPCLCPLLGLILFPWFCVIVLALPVTRIIFVFFPSQRLLRRLVEATQRSVP